MKTIEELNTLKNEVEALNSKLAELSEEELTEVTGGMKIVVIKASQESVDNSDIKGFVPIP